MSRMPKRGREDISFERWVILNGSGICLPAGRVSRSSSRHAFRGSFAKSGSTGKFVSSAAFANCISSDFL